MSDIEDKCDVILDINDPDFAAKFMVAIGAAPGEGVEIVTPQFNRTDGLLVPVPLVDFRRIHELSVETLREIGCCLWDDKPIMMPKDGELIAGGGPRAEDCGKLLWLFPAEWYEHLPDGLDVVDIFYLHETFRRGVTDDDRRFGMLSFGFLRAPD